jgi:hypothetical protein
MSSWAAVAKYHRLGGYLSHQGTFLKAKKSNTKVSVGLVPCVGSLPGF